MPSGKGKIVLMGSGELTSTMVEVHKGLLNQLPGSRRAAFLDTPAGFQLNVDQISRKAVEYFQKRVQRPLAVSSFKSRENTPPVDAEDAFRKLRESAYILIGPGSPTYAVEQWKRTPVPEIFAQCVSSGGCLVAASAAALTVGRFTLPVYEIYKVGQKPHWVAGIDILGKFGLDLVVIPHWNNAEGGTHDTRFCFMGEQRLQELVGLLPEKVPVFGLDEHTACILNLAADEAEVKGIGTVTLRHRGRDLTFKAGERFSLDVLRSVAADSDWQPGVEAVNLEPGEPDSDRQAGFWDRVHSLERRFQNGLVNQDARESTNALLELDRSIWQAQTDLENEAFVIQARDTFRDLIVLLGNELAAAPENEAECMAPLVDALLKLRQNFRKNKKWAEADAIRDILHRARIRVEDTADGSRWHLASNSESGYDTELPMP